MNILAIDTAMAACSAAVLDAATDIPIAARFAAMERGHAEALAPMVQSAMIEAGIAFTALDRICVTIGPGTFTGVRIGLAMARGIGVACRIPVIGIDSLTAIAANDAAYPGPMLVVVHARNDEVYAGVADAQGTCIMAPRVVPVAQAADLAPAGGHVIGTAAEAVIAASGRTDLRRSAAGDLPVAARFGRLAARQPAADHMPSPLYLRAPDAKPQPEPVRRAGLPDMQPAGVDAAGLLAELHAQCFDPSWSAAAFANLLQMPGARALIAHDNGRPTGFLLTRRAADEAEIITVGTLPAARKHGVARAMIAHEFSELAVTGVRHAFIEVAASNTPARALYKSLGFAEAGVRRGYYERAGGLREDATIMRRVLQP